jgi:hypothetical protein
MKKVLISVFAVGLGMTANLMAQVPNYVPTNGLVGWWPFNGNANDESGNGNNGGFTGLSCSSCGNVTAPPTTALDRFNNTSSAFQFSNSFDLISIPNSSSLQVTTQFTISIWANPNTGNYGSGPSYLNLLQKWGGTGTGASYMAALNPNGKPMLYTNNGVTNSSLTATSPISLNKWTLITFTFNNGLGKIFLNGILNTSANNLLVPAMQNSSIEIARNLNQFANYSGDAFAGILDDIGIWNRALTECEIQDLYQAQLGSFSNSAVSVNPTSSTIGSSASLYVNSPISSLQWQSNPSNVGWVNLSNNNQYSGATNDTLVVSYLQLSNHNQPFRVLACGDTSSIASIQIADTCITTIYDTLLTAVTDTLIINTTLGLPSPNNTNTIKVYPNPANDHITIDYGNYAIMNGHQLRIENSLAQQVFQTNITQQSDYLSLSAWGGNGLYYVHIIDPQGNTVDIKKIVLQ